MYVYPLQQYMEACAHVDTQSASMNVCPWQQYMEVCTRVYTQRAGMYVCPRQQYMEVCMRLYTERCYVCVPVVAVHGGSPTCLYMVTLLCMSARGCSTWEVTCMFACSVSGCMCACEWCSVWRPFGSILGTLGPVREGM